MNIEKLKKMLAAKLEQKKNLDARMIESDSKEERAAIGETLAALAAEIKDCEELLSEMNEPAEPNDTGAASAASAGEGRKMFTLASKEQRGGNADEEDGTSTVQYRKAFQKYIATGKMEARADASTTTTDTNVSTVIPQNLVNKILEEYEMLGVIYNLVTKTSYAVGQSIPVDNVKPTATWVAEGATSDSQEKTLKALITFTHHKLRCEIRYSEEVAVMTLSAFEALFVKQVGEAMIRAIEAAIVDGDGTGKPTGILANTPDTGKAITYTSATGITYKTLCECEGAVPANKETGTKWCMTKKTFMQFIGMTDDAGQPIARVNYGISGKPERVLLGRDVVIYEPQSGSKLGNTVTAFMFDFADYVLNTNYDLGISHAKDWDNEDHKTKAVLACDGKVIDKTSLITLAVAS